MAKAPRSVWFKTLGLCWLSAGFLMTACASSGTGEAEPQVLAEIHAVPVASETIAPGARAVGSLEPMLGRSADIVPTSPGRILEVKVREGDRVAKGQLLVRMETGYHARAENTQAQQALAAAELQAGRAKRLYEAGVWAKSASEEADRALVAARSQERAAGVDAKQEAQSADLRAPLAGVVSGLTATVGAVAEGSAPLMKVVDASELLARLQLPVRDAQQVAVGSKVTLTVPALQGTAPLESAVWRKALPLETGNQYAQLQVRLDNAGGLLAPGMAVEAMVALPSRKGLVVPSEAVVTKSAATVVFRIEGDRAVQVAVRATELDKGRSEVAGEGLKAGDPVATVGAYELSDGMAVKVAR